MLFIHHGKAQILEGHPFLEQRMGADHDGQRSIRQPLQHPPSFLALHTARQQRDRHPCGPAKPLKAPQMLPGEQFRRRHQSGLGARFHRAQHGHQRDQSFARADIALQQAQHPPWRRQISINLGHGLKLGWRWRMAKGGQGGAAQTLIAHQRPARPFARPAPHQAKGDLPCQQFIIAKPAARRLGALCLGRVQGAQGIGKARPGFALQQRAIHPFRHIRQGFQRPIQRIRHIPPGKPRRQRPHGLPKRDAERRFDQRVRIQFQLPGALIGFEPPSHTPFSTLGEGASQRRARPSSAGEGNQRHRISAAHRRHRPGPAPAARRCAGDAEFQRYFLPFDRLGQAAQNRAMLHAFRQMQQQIQHTATARRTRQQFCLAQPGQAFNRRQ